MSDTPPPKEKRREIQQKRQKEHAEKVHAASNVIAEDHSEAEVERVADACLTASELREANSTGLSATEYVRAEYVGVNPAEYPTDTSLQAAMSASRRGETVEAGRFVSSNHRDRDGRSQRDRDTEASEPSEDEIEAMADGVLTNRQRIASRNMGGAAALIRSEFGVDPSNYGNEQDLMAAMSKARRSREE